MTTISESKETGATARIGYRALFGKHIGQRVTRPVFMDDGTWLREGDSCLKRSPLLRGEVVRRDTERADAIWVKWDFGETRKYLDHGVDPVDPPNAERSREG